MAHHLDDIDKHILYTLMTDARSPSAPAIAEEMNVSPATIRNRIAQLEEQGIIRGYTAQIDFEQANGRLTNLYICTVPVDERETLAHETRAIPGVVNVRELMTGRRNLHVLAVGNDTDDLRRISGTVSKLGIDIEDEHLVQNESDSPYAPFGPDDQQVTRDATNFISLTGNANVIEITVRNEAPVNGRTIEELARVDVLPSEALVIAIERDDQVLTPHGETTIETDDIVTVLSRGGEVDRVLEAFAGKS
ncbi:TrkA C-terminal domain-containing protein [Halovenus rubra]|uniref:TrkA C-terminal domain-containing protein n=2 Tax=Halovenus rubra TaxID=869890 RepID=A0ABD5X6H1_9EURY|nr:TrkA C-terminal domain-containing protein [Halovenus rubra]